MASVNDDRSSNSVDTDRPRKNEAGERERYSRARMNRMKVAGFAFLTMATAVILMALYSLKLESNRPKDSKKSAMPAMIALLGVFVSLSGSSFFMNAGQMKKRIETVESLLREGKSDDEIAALLGLRPDTVRLVRTEMKG